MDPRTGTFKEYPIPTANSEPHHLHFDSAGTLWFVEFAANKLARLDQATGTIKEYTIPTPDGHPHDLTFTSKGQLWFTMGGLFFAGKPANRLGMFDPVAERIQEFRIPPDDSVPHGITVGAGDELWVSLFFKGKIVRATADLSGITRLTEYLLLSNKGQPHGLVLDRDRNLIWFTDHRGGSIGRLAVSKAEPGTSKGMDQFAIPGCDRCNPNSIVLDQAGNVWFTEMGMFFRGRFANKIGKLIP